MRDFSRIPAVLPQASWLVAFTTAGGADYKANTAVGEQSRRALEHELLGEAVGEFAGDKAGGLPGELRLTWLDLQHGARVVIDPSTSRPTSESALVPVTDPAAAPASGSALVSVAASAAAPASKPALVPVAAPASVAANVATEPAPVPADAAWVTRPGQAIAFTTADCLPIVLADLQGKRVCGIHAGWRSLADGVVQNSLAAFAADLNSASLHAWIGPAIAQCDYEVGRETHDALRAVTALQVVPKVAAAAFVPTRPNHWLADLPLIATAILTHAGLNPAHIVVCPTSTFASPELHSARRDGAASGRMATVAGIRKSQLPENPS